MAPDQEGLQKIEKVSTGIERLDELFYGGFDRNDNIMVRGNNFSQKRSFIYNFIRNAANSGNNVILADFDFPSEGIMVELARNGTNTDMIHILDGFAKPFQISPPANTEVLEEPDNLPSVLKQISTSVQQMDTYVFVMLSATRYLLSQDKNADRFFIQLINMNRKRSIVSLYAVDDFIPAERTEWFAYLMDSAVHFKNDGDRDYMRVLTLKRIRTKEWVRIYPEDSTFTLGSFNVERIK